MCLAIPGQILSIQDEDGVAMADVNFGGVEKRVCLQYLPDAAVGEYVVVHVGFAIQQLDEASALETLANFATLGLLEQELGAGFAQAERERGDVIDGSRAQEMGRT
jgi:hydrogenase expression/formation protein HypC